MWPIRVITAVRCWWTCIGTECAAISPEPERGPRNWKDKQQQQKQVYGNRRCVGGRRGTDLQKLRSERMERSFAHLYETGGMRRTYLRKHNNILKRLQFHAIGFNLALLLRERFGIGKPRTFQGASSDPILFLRLFWAAIFAECTKPGEFLVSEIQTSPCSSAFPSNEDLRVSTTGC